MVDLTRFGNPGFNPNAPDPRKAIAGLPGLDPNLLQQITAQNTQQDAGGIFGKLDNFLTQPGGGFLLNLLAQSGRSLTPGPSPLGAIGRAALTTQAQGRQAGQDDLKRRLIESQIGLNEFGASGAGLNATGGNVQTTFEGQNGNMWFIRRGGGDPVDTGVPFNTNVQLLERADGSVIAVDKSTGAEIGRPVSSDEASGINKRAALEKSRNANQAAAISELPTKQLAVEKARTEVARLRNHPGKSSAQGLKGASLGFGMFSTPIAGTDAADFTAIRDQAAGGAFLEAYQQLKGGGPITDREGEAALAAMTRIGNPNITEAEFDRALDDFIEALDAGFEKMKEAAKGDDPIDEFDGFSIKR